MFKQCHPFWPKRRRPFPYRLVARPPFTDSPLTLECFHPDHIAEVTARLNREIRRDWLRVLSILAVIALWGAFYDPKPQIHLPKNEYQYRQFLRRQSSKTPPNRVHPRPAPLVPSVHGNANQEPHKVPSQGSGR